MMVGEGRRKGMVGGGRAVGKAWATLSSGTPITCAAHGDKKRTGTANERPHTPETGGNTIHCDTNMER